MSGGYTDCACRDCFEIAIGIAGKAYCNACEEAGCDDYQGVEGLSQECQAEGAYGGDDGCEHCGDADADECDLGAHGTVRLCGACATACQEGGPCPLGDGCPEDHGKAPEAPECPFCGGEGVVLGGLGNLMHFRCRGCGTDFHKTAGVSSGSPEPSVGSNS